MSQLKELLVSGSAKFIGKLFANDIHTTTIIANKINNVTASEINQMGGVTGNVQAQLDNRSLLNHVHNYAGSSTPGGAATVALKCTGNADTATVLETARIILLSGAVTGSVIFNGARDVEIITSVNHTHPYLALTGGTLNSSEENVLVLNRNTTDGNSALVFSNNTKTLGKVLFTSSNIALSLDGTNIATLSGSDVVLTGNVTAPIFVGALSGTANRAINDSNGNNISTYYTTVGTNQSISGTKIFTTNPSIVNATNAALTILNSNGGDSSLILDRAGMAGWKMYVSSGTLRFATDYTGNAKQASFTDIFTLNCGTGVNDYKAIFAGEIQSASFIGAIKGNADTATKLATARSIVIGGQSKSFDGTAAIAFDLETIGASAVGHTHNYLPLTGGNMNTGATIKFFNDDDGIIFNNGNYVKSFGIKTSDIISLGSVCIGNELSNLIYIDSTCINATNNLTNVPLNIGVGIITGTVTATSFIGALTGNATTANYLQTARNITIGNQTKAFDGSAAISFDLVTIGASAVGHTHNYLPLTGGTVTGTITGTTFVGSVNGNANTATLLQTARNINGVSFNGSTDITIADATKLPLTGGTLTGSLTAPGFIGALTGNASTATILQTARNIIIGSQTKAFNGSADITFDLATIGASAVGHTHNYLPLTGGTITGTLTGTTFIGALTGNASTATLLQTARTINGVSFNGGSNITILAQPDSIDYGTTSVDANTLKSTGFYFGARFYNTPSNTTAPATDMWWYVQVEEHNNTGWCKQTATCYGSGATGGYTSADTYIRTQENGTWTPWYRVYTSAHPQEISSAATSCTGNAATATTLQTARNITIGSQTKVFNGSADITFDLATIGASALGHTHDYLRIIGGTVTGPITAPTFNGVLNGNAATATKLATARAINGISFDGSVDITIADATKLPLSGGTLTGNLTAPTFIGALTGNASTATKLAAARTITVGATGKSFDGSVAISYSLAEIGAAPAVDSHNYMRVYNTATIGNSNTMTVNDLAGQAYTCGMINAITDNPTGTASWVHAISMGWGDTNLSWISQIAVGVGNSNGMWYRTTQGSVVGVAWKRLLDSSNYNSYSPTLTGAGASGTWDVNVTGNASTATKLQTARNITIGNATKAFDGSGNLAFTLAEIGASTGVSGNYLPLAGGTMNTGARLNMLGATGIDTYINLSGGGYETYIFPSSISTGQLITSDIITIGNISGGRMELEPGGAITAYSSGSTIQTLDFFSPVVFNQPITASSITGNLIGNASTATTLAVSRTITIGNNAKSFNGSSNIAYTLAEIGAAPSSHVGSAGTGVHLVATSLMSGFMSSTDKAKLDLYSDMVYSWSPGLTNAAYTTDSYSHFKYTRHGNVVHFSFRANVTAAGTWDFTLPIAGSANMSQVLQCIIATGTIAAAYISGASVTKVAIQTSNLSNTMVNVTGSYIV